MPTACVPKVLDFNGFQYVYGRFDHYCVFLTAFAKTGANGQRRGYTPINNIHLPAGGAARIYDTGDGDDCDVDLFITFDLCRKAVGGWAHFVRLQHPEIHSPIGSSSTWWCTNLCKDFDWEDHHVGC